MARLQQVQHSSSDPFLQHCGQQGRCQQDQDGDLNLGFLARWNVGCKPLRDG